MNEILANLEIGEELAFLVSLPNEKVEKALELAERISKIIKDYDERLQGNNLEATIAFFLGANLGVKTFKETVASNE